jgi:hypothetical protein
MIYPFWRAIRPGRTGNSRRRMKQSSGSRTSTRFAHCFRPSAKQKEVLPDPGLAVIEITCVSECSGALLPLAGPPAIGQVSNINSFLNMVNSFSAPWRSPYTALVGMGKRNGPGRPFLSLAMKRN